MNTCRCSCARQLNELIDWAQEQESAYAEKTLRLSGIVAMKDLRDNAMAVSKTFTATLEKIEQVTNSAKPLTKGLAHQLRMFFGKAA